MQRIGDLELDQDLAFERRQWTVQRVGWWLMLLAVVLGLLGLFGTGPLSSATARGDGVTVDYERFVRRHGEGELTIAIAPNQAQNGQVEVWLADAWLDAVTIEGISPEPASQHPSGDRQVYVFEVADPARPFTVRIDYRPQEMGRLPAELGIGSGEGLDVFQFSYP